MNTTNTDTLNGDTKTAARVTKNSSTCLQTTKTAARVVCKIEVIDQCTSDRHDRGEMIDVDVPLSELLIKNLTSLCPSSLKDWQIKKAVTKYLEVMLPAIASSLGNDFDDVFKVYEFPFAQRKVSDAIGDIACKSIYRLMSQSASTRLVDVTFKGNKGRNSRVMLNERFKEKVMEEINEMDKFVSEKELAEIRKNANRIMFVDPNSLYSYIAQTQLELSKGHNTRYVETLQRNILSAKRLVNLIEEDKNEITGEITYFVREEWYEADCGRMYGKGYSLQSRHKNVRHAALGDCHKYDFMACSFSIMAAVAEMINPDIQTSMVREYVRYRKGIRKTIATNTGIPEDKIKAIFTSLGFGAEVKNSPYTAIRKGLTQEQFVALQADKTFSLIYEELQTITDTILAHEGFQGQFKLGDKVFDEIDPKSLKGGLRNKNQRAAWIYQCLEADAMHKFIAYAKKFSDQDPLLTTHDCIYYKRKLPAEAIKDITYLLRDDYKYLQFEHEAIYPIRTEQDFANRFEEQRTEEELHKYEIAVQERQAKNYVPKSFTNLNIQVRHSFEGETGAELMARIDSQPDYEYDVDESY